MGIIPGAHGVKGTDLRLSSRGERDRLIVSTAWRIPGESRMTPGSLRSGQGGGGGGEGEFAQVSNISPVSLHLPDQIMVRYGNA
jgi:hypothetical protein